MSREQFEKWAKDNDFSVQTHPKLGYLRLSTGSAWKVWQARQPEIDAKDKAIDDLALEKGILKAEIGRLEDEITNLKEVGCGVLDANAALKAEVEQMLEAIKEVDVLIRNNLPVDKTTPAWSMIKKILYK